MTDTGDVPGVRAQASSDEPPPLPPKPRSMTLPQPPAIPFKPTSSPSPEVVMMSSSSSATAGDSTASSSPARSMPMPGQHTTSSLDSNTLIPSTAPPSYEEIATSPSSSSIPRAVEFDSSKSTSSATARRAAVRAPIYHETPYDPSRMMDLTNEDEVDEFVDDDDSSLPPLERLTEAKHLFSWRHVDVKPDLDHTITWWDDSTDSFITRHMNSLHSFQTDPFLDQQVCGLPQDVPEDLEEAYRIQNYYQKQKEEEKGDEKREWSPQPFTVDVDPLRRTSERSFAGLYNVGWTAAKIVTMPLDFHEAGGVWGSMAAWDVQVGMTPHDDPKYKPMGTFIHVRSAPKVDLDNKMDVDTGAVATTPSEEVAGEVDLIDLNERGTESTRPFDATSDATTSTSKEHDAVSAASNLPRASVTGSVSSDRQDKPQELPGYRTITKDELEDIKPHRNLFFCRQKMGWGLFGPFDKFPPKREPIHDFDDDEPSRSEEQIVLWQRSHLNSSAPLILLSSMPKQPIPPADPKAFSDSSYLVNHPKYLDANSLHVLHRSTDGAMVGYSGFDLCPSVFPSKLWQEFEHKMTSNPAPGQSGLLSMFKAVKVIWIAIDNLLFKGEHRALPTRGRTFSNAMTWEAVISDIFVATLGFKYVDTNVEPGTLSPPSIDDQLPEGATNRKRLLRAWLELSIWIEDVRIINESTTAFAAVTWPKTRVQLSPARNQALHFLGGQDFPRVAINEAILSRDVMETTGASREYDFLGVPFDAPDEVIGKVYKAQIKLQPQYQPEFLTAVENICQYRRSETLQTLVVQEKSFGKPTAVDLREAYKILQLDPMYSTNLLELRSVDEETIFNQFQRRDTEIEHPERKKALYDALKILAEVKNSELLRGIYESITGVSSKPEMTEERVWYLLGSGSLEQAEDEQIILVAEVAADQNNKEQIKEAVRFLAEKRNSDRLRRYAETGETGNEDSNDGWQATLATSVDIPVGLTNIANTCYLNSLLQYLFTVRQLREAVLTYEKPESAAVGELSRVGGREVTKAEVERSKRFVELLQGLFKQLIHSPVTAVTPETELAYLALVPSKEEEQFKQTKEEPTGATSEPPTAGKGMQSTIKDSPKLSTSTAALASPPLPDGSRSPSILGKRRNDEVHQIELESGADAEVQPMKVDHQSGINSPHETIISGALDDASQIKGAHDQDDERSNKRGKSVDDGAGISTTLDSTAGNDDTSVSGPIDKDVREVEHVENVAMAEAESAASPVVAGPPPLPPRPIEADAKSKEKELSQQVSNYMAFGRQNDVTECMDNVIFQLECAFKPTASKELSDVIQILKKTFYGMTQQQLVFEDTTIAEPVRTRQEPFFSLLVDVAEEGRNVYDGLDAVFDDSPVEIEGKAARRLVSLVEVPDLLQIQLQRVQYDRVKQSIFKSNHYMAFGPELRLERYLHVSEDDVKGQEKKAKTAKLRAEIERCRGALDVMLKPENKAELIRGLLEYVGKLPELEDIRDEQFAEDLVAESAYLADEINAMQQRIQALRQELEELWSGETEGAISATYELVSVFMHRGTATSGHYFIYQRDSHNPKRWLKYNDATVTEVDAEQVVFAPTNGDTNAYFLVYCKRDRIDAIDSIARQL
ncbi:ubiquitin-specific protease ubp2 [Microbotryomycetes sp. JL221]|nr:ubiquitin-specific protease ubp2 [Microbotryomycetes sp. JL221]